MTLAGIEPTLLITYLITYHALSRILGSNIKSSLNHLQLGSDLTTAYRALFVVRTEFESVIHTVNCMVCLYFTLCFNHKGVRLPCWLYPIGIPRFPPPDYFATFI